MGWLAAGCVIELDLPEPEPASSGADAAAGADADSPPDPACAPASSGSTLPAYAAREAITIDGTLSEPAWQTAASVSFENVARSENRTTVAALWTATDLYFAFSVVDDALETAGLIEALHQDDGAELYLDTAHDATMLMNEDDYHFITNVADASVGGPMQIATQISATGFTQEIALSWSTLAASPAPDMVVGLLLGNNDREDGLHVQYDWMALIDSGFYDRPNLWGDLLLSGPCPPTP